MGFALYIRVMMSWSDDDDDDESWYDDDNGDESYDMMMTVISHE